MYFCYFFVIWTFGCKDMTCRFGADFEKKHFSQSWQLYTVTRDEYELKCLAGGEGERRTSMCEMAKD